MRILRETHPRNLDPRIAHGKDRIEHSAKRIAFKNKNENDSLFPDSVSNEGITKDMNMIRTSIAPCALCVIWNAMRYAPCAMRYLLCAL